MRQRSEILSARYAAYKYQQNEVSCTPAIQKNDPGSRSLIEEGSSFWGQHRNSSTKQSLDQMNTREVTSLDLH